jgi:hypothetical protein
MPKPFGWRRARLEVRLVVKLEARLVVKLEVRLGPARGEARGKVLGMQNLLALLESGVSLADAKRKLGISSLTKAEPRKMKI